MIIDCGAQRLVLILCDWCRIHDGTFVQKVLDLVKEDKARFQTAELMIGKLSVILEELPDCPLYYITDDLAKKFHCTPPNMMQIRQVSTNYWNDF